MVRSALGPAPRATGKGPPLLAETIPWLSVLVASALALLPIVARVGWWPHVALLLLLAWRINGADCWHSWVAALLGLADDVLRGAPIGLSMALWPAIMLAMDVVDRRTMWRDWRIEWLIAAAFILLVEFIEWRVAGNGGAPIRFALVWPAMLVSVLVYPLAALLVGRLDRWRKGR